MKARRPSLFLFFATLSVLPAAPARAEVPEAGLRERQWDLARAYERFEAGRFEQALAGFEAAAREPAPLPPEALRRWGVGASEAGWPLAAYVRLRQYVAVVLRLVVGEEEHVRQALRGEPYEALRGVADMIMEFALTAQAKP